MIAREKEVRGSIRVVCINQHPFYVGTKKPIRNKWGSTVTSIFSYNLIVYSTASTALAVFRILFWRSRKSTVVDQRRQQFGSYDVIVTLCDVIISSRAS